MPFVPKTDPTDLPFTPSAKPVEDMNDDELMREIDQLYKDMDKYMALKEREPPTTSQPVVDAQPEPTEDALPELTEDEILRIVHESHGERAEG